MSGRTDRSRRVVICDDVSWSEPTRSSRRAVAELEPPSWAGGVDSSVVIARSARPAERERRGDSRRHEVEHHDDLGRVDADSFDPFDSFDSRDEGEPGRLDPRDLDPRELDPEEAIWGPRPRLMSAEPGGRRTVVITGHVADRALITRAPSRDRAPAPLWQGLAADRTAMWAVLLCVIVLLVAITSH